MNITKVKLCNYKQYYGLQSIVIPNKNKIIIIKGENGAGKTNFINGLTWCLYQEKADYEELVNDKALQELEIEKSLNMYIEIHFEHENTLHILNRKIIVYKQDENKYRFEEDCKLDTINGAEKNSVNKISIEAYINNILNESVKSYFFFDGARIETFTKDDHNKDVEKAIKNLLKIETIIRSRDHIKNVISDIKNSMDNNDNETEVNIIEGEIEKLEQETRCLTDDIDNLENEISAADKDIKNSYEELNHIQRNSTYKEQLNDYQKKKADKQEKLDTCSNEIFAQLHKSYLCFADKLMDDANQILKKKTSGHKNQNYSAMLKEFIKESLDENKCYLCNEPINNEKREYLLNKLPELVGEIIDHPNIIEQSTSFTLVAKEGREVLKDMTQLKKRSNEYNKEIEEIVNVINDLDTKIDNDCPDTLEYKLMIEKLEKVRTEKITAKVHLENKVIANKRLISEKEREHIELISKIDKYKIEQEKLEVCYKIREELDRIFGMYEKNEILKINNETKKIFDLIIRKEDVFKTIYIDEKYILNVQREFSEKNILKQLSYGERQILSLSLIFALANVSGDQGPFVVDTPMGNLDPIHRRKLISNVTKFVNQIFFLVTSSEFTEELYQLCYNDISVEYDLLTQKQGMTLIEKR